MRRLALIYGIGSSALLVLGAYYCYSLRQRVDKLELALKEAANAREELREAFSRLQVENRNLRVSLEDLRAESSSESAVKEAKSVVSANTHIQQQERLAPPTLSLAERADIFVGGIERITTLSSDERDALRESFSQAEDRQVSLDEILGEERARFVRDQQRAAFSHSKLEEVEKNAYYFSKKLGLNSAQELEVLNALTDIQSELDLQREIQGSEPLTPRERMQQMIKDAELYRKRLLNSMKAILRPEQLEQYLEYDEQSSAASMELWHAPAEAKSEK